ncbi:MAG: hypothetical protein IT433_09000 [Phycisphaerales bacterium]|nr:hypothetical protein [Phycisphaerales bacterium]
MGLDGAALVVRDVRPVGEASYSTTESRRLEGVPLRRTLHLLRRMADLVEIAERRGVRFQDLLHSRRADPTGRGRLPTHRVTWRGGDSWAWSEGEALDAIAKAGLRLADRSNETPAAGRGEEALVRELHENRELERLFAELADLGLPVDVETYAGVQKEAVTGERVPARFAWVLGEDRGSQPVASADESDDHPHDIPDDEAKAKSPPSREVECPNLPAVMEGLRAIGRRGMQVKRFKGLGEMDAEQLWETTMDPTRRTLLKVTWDMGSNADALFSVLMGEEVEPRRRFIEDHALEVKNLDV